MFTGIVEHVGYVETLDITTSGGRLRVDAGPLSRSLSPACSVAVNGCCLTVVEILGTAFVADLSAETLRRTNLGDKKAGSPVNLERPLSVGKELGGHFVQGHVDGVGHVARLSSEGQNWWLAVRVPLELERYLALKGSVAVDGISLTVANLHDSIFEVAIIPYTYSHTNLLSLVVGDLVNVETDILAKYVERLVSSRTAASASKIDIEKLVANGF